MYTSEDQDLDIIDKVGQGVIYAILGIHCIWIVAAMINLILP